MMFGQLPPPVRVLWHLVGERKYRRYIKPVREGRPARGRGGVVTAGAAQPRTDRPTGPGVRRAGGGHFALAGAVCGLTWSCALRGWMVAVAGPESTITWVGTLGGVLAPGVLVGGRLGWAEWRRRSGQLPSGWLVASPALLGLAPLAVPGVLSSLISTGHGSGAPAMVSLAIIAGYSLSGRGSLKRRSAAAVLGFAVLPALWLAPPMTPQLSTTTSYGALVALTFSTLFVVLARACAIPMQAPASRTAHDVPPDAARYSEGVRSGDRPGKAPR